MTKPSSIYIRGGRCIDPSQNLDGLADVFISEGRISDLPARPPSDALVLDAAKCYVVPGLIDMHVHLREPGGEHKETIETGTMAAAAGGFTTVGCMPNTAPALDSPEVIRRVIQRAGEVGHCRVYPVGAVTRGLMGQELVDLESLSESGCVAFSDDGHGVASSVLMIKAIERLKAIDKILIQHCEDPSFSGGVMHEGPVAQELGYRGISPLAEQAMLSRDLKLAESVGARYHVAHVSTRGSVELIRKAKSKGIRVTCEVCPHHLLLNHHACRNRDPNFKVNPPLRAQTDVAACIEGVADGTIDILVTDHAPHAPEEKAMGFVRAPFGVIGLETALPLWIKALVEPGHLSWMKLIEMMSTKPASIFGLSGGTLRTGSPADVTIIDPSEIWTIDAERFFSKGRNCPFDGWEVKGKVRYTIVDGNVQYSPEMIRR